MPSARFLSDKISIDSQRQDPQILILEDNSLIYQVTSEHSDPLKVASELSKILNQTNLSMHGISNMDEIDNVEVYEVTQVKMDSGELLQIYNQSNSAIDLSEKGETDAKYNQVTGITENIA